MQKLFKRGDIWWCWVRDITGRSVRKSTRRRDYTAALEEAANLERIAATEARAGTKKQSIHDAFVAYIVDLDRRQRSAATKEIARQKVGHFLRIWNPNMPVYNVTAALVTRYIDTRQKEGVKNFTIKKELGHLRQTLVLARYNRTFSEELDRVFPPFFVGGHVPKTRAPSYAEVAAVLEHLQPHRAAHVAFLVATGARIGESVRARREDINLESGLVLLRGTKTIGALRRVPVTKLTRSFLEYAVEHAPGEDPLFRIWWQVNADIKDACRRAGVEKFGPNDLRRAFATWHRDAGISPSLIAPLLGHTTDKLAQTTYARLRPAELGRLLDEQLETKLGLAWSGTARLGGAGQGKGADAQVLVEDEKTAAPVSGLCCDPGVAAPVAPPNPVISAPPARIELATNGLGNLLQLQHRPARSVGNSMAWAERTAAKRVDCAAKRLLLPTHARKVPKSARRTTEQDET